MADAVIVPDTSILSRVLRRREAARNGALCDFFRNLLFTRRMAVPGVVLQELLSGMRESDGRAALLDRMAHFPRLFAHEEDHRLAAEIVNKCQSGGIAAGTMDALIAAQAIRAGAEVLTADRDFTRIALRIPELQLVPIPADLLP